MTDRLSGLTTSVAVKAPCKAVSTTALTLSGEQTVNGVACVSGDRVLYALSGGSVNNGIWVVSTGAWARAKDFDGNRDVVTGTQVLVVGSGDAATVYRVTTTGSITIGTTAIEFTAGGVSDSASVNFIPAGAGAVTRSVQSKLRDWVSVDDYGVTGDGVADDTAELQAAITAAAGRVLVAPVGAVYYITAALTCTQPIVIFAYGAKIVTASHINAFTITSSDVAILGLEIEGAGNAAFSTNGRLITASGTDNGAAVAPTYIKNIVIQDCKLHDAGRCGIRFDFVQKASIQRNDIYEVVYAGCELLSCLDVDFSHNFVKDVTPGTSSNMYGVFASRTNAADLVRYPVCERIDVVHNRFENIDWEGIDCHGGDELDFSHNVLTNCGDSNAAIAIIHTDNESSVPVAAATNVTVVGNRIVGAQQYGIATSSGSATIIHKNITIQGNTLENCGASNTSNDVGGIRIGAAINVSVIGNALNYCAPYGVVVNNQYADGVTVDSNTFNRIVSNTETTPSAILVDRGASATGTIVIGGNTLLLAATGETYEAVNGVRVVSTDTGSFKIQPNDFDGATTKYSMTATQWGGSSFAVLNAGNDSIAVTTSVATASKAITLTNSHSGNTLYVPSAVIFSTTANDERTIIHCTRTSTTQITVTVYTAGGANFAANGNINFFYETKGV